MQSKNDVNFSIRDCETLEADLRKVEETMDRDEKRAALFCAVAELTWRRIGRRMDWKSDEEE